METHTLTTPITTPNTVGYQVGELSMNWPKAILAGCVLDTNGNEVKFYYSGETALTRIRLINIANFSITSLHARLLIWLAADGFIGPGTVTGTPD